MNARALGLAQQRSYDRAQQQRLARAPRAKNGEDDFWRLARPVFQRVLAGAVRADRFQLLCGAEQQRSRHSRAALTGTAKHPEPAGPDIPVDLFTVGIGAPVRGVWYVLETGDAAQLDMPRGKNHAVHGLRGNRGGPHTDRGEIDREFVRQPDPGSEQHPERHREDQASPQAKSQRCREC